MKTPEPLLGGMLGLGGSAMVGVNAYKWLDSDKSLYEMRKSEYYHSLDEMRKSIYYHFLDEEEQKQLGGMKR